MNRHEPSRHESSRHEEFEAAIVSVHAARARSFAANEGTATTSISVVIATFNRLDSLLWLLDDLDAQRDVGGGFEVIVVDDGSSVAVELEVRARPHPFSLAVLRQANAGPSVARDAGIRASSGEVIVIIDDDMVIPADFLAAHQRSHDAGAAVVLGLIRAPRFGQRLPLFERFHQDSLDRFVAAYRAGTAAVEGTRLCTGNVSFLRSQYFAVGGFDLSLMRCEDRDLGIRFERAGLPFALTEEGWSDHRSDHEEVSTWRRRSGLYGELDLKIAEKHPGVPSVSPWAFLRHLPAVALPVVIAASLAPPLGRFVAGASYRLGLEFDRMVKESPGGVAAPRVVPSRANRLLRRASVQGGAAKLAIVAASLCYGCDYYSGVGASLRRRGGTRSVVASIVGFFRAERAAKATR